MEIEKLLDIVGSIASIASLIVGIIVLVLARAIKRDFLNRARLPPLKKLLKGHAKKLTSLTIDIDNNLQEIRTELSRAKATADNLLKKELPGELKKQIKGWIRQTEQILPRDNEGSLWSWYIYIQSFFQEIKQSSIQTNKDLILRVDESLQELNQAIDLHIEDRKWR